MKTAFHIVRGLTVVALSLDLAAAAAADYQASYGNGIEAFEQKRWAEAAEWFRKAIEENPDAGGKIRVAGKRQPYVPYYQLGLALYRAGALWEASTVWRTSMLQGKLDKKMRRLVDEYQLDIDKRLEEQAAEASSDPAPPPRLSGDELERRRRAALRQLERADRQIARLEAPDLRAVLDEDPSLATRRDQGIAMVREAREIYEKAGKSGDPIALQEVHERAVDAAGALEDVVFSATVLTLRKGRSQ